MHHLRLANWDTQAAYDTLTAQRNTRLGLTVLAPSTMATQNEAATAQAQPTVGPGTGTVAASSPAGAGSVIATQEATDVYRIIDTMTYSADDFEQERCLTAVLFRDQIQARSNNSPTLSVSQIDLFLQVADWDIGHALDD